MRKKIWFGTLALAGGLVVVLAMAWTFRTGLIRLVTNRVLTANEVAVTRLEKLQIGASHAATAGMELQLSSGQRLVLSDVALDYRITSWTQAPVVQAITVGSAQLLSATDAGSAESGGTEAEPLLLGDVLQLLREMPLTAVAISQLSLPDYHKPLALSLHHDAGTLILRVDNSDLQFLTSFTQADAAATAVLQVTLARGSETVGNFSASLQPMQETYALQGEGRLQFADLNTLLGQLQQAPLALPLKSANLDWTLAGSVANDFTGTFKAGAAAPATFTLGIAAGSTFALALPDSGIDALDATLKERAELVVSTGMNPRISTGTLPVRASGQWSDKPFSADSVMSLTDCSAATCRLNFNGTATFDTYSMTGVIAVDVLPAPDSISRYHVKTTDLSIGGLEQWLPPFDIDANLTLDDEQLTFDTPLLLRNAPADAGVSAKGDYQFASGNFNARLDVPTLEFSEQGRKLSNWLSGWPYTFDVLSGTLSTQIALGWQPPPATITTAAEGVLTATFELQADNLGGFYNDIFFRGLSSDLTGDINTGAAFAVDTPELAVTLDGVDVGVPIDNIKLNFRLNRAARQLLVSSMSGDTLGGTIGGNNLRYVFGAERNELKLEFNGLRIERMMELADYDGVQASGGVSGELPLTLTATGVEIGAGTLHADAPGGTIRYLSTVGTAGDPGIDLVNKALANYQYDSLTSSIVYSPEGELVLGMQLQGTNPEVSKDQRINLNLNLTDNIPALLKSLQAAREIEDFLQQQYQ